MQTEVYHLRIETGVSDILKRQGERCGMSASLFAVHLLRAAAVAIQNETGPVIPPRFEFTAQNPVLNETAPPYKTRRK